MELVPYHIVCPANFLILLKVLCLHKQTAKINLCGDINEEM